MRNLLDLVNSAEGKTFGTLAKEAEGYENHTLDEKE
jgi:hypothetical protein